MDKPLPSGPVAPAPEIVKKPRDSYKFDMHGQPICPSCGYGTNAAYADHPKLTCWHCSANMDGSPTEIQKFLERVLHVKAWHERAAIEHERAIERIILNNPNSQFELERLLPALKRDREFHSEAAKMLEFPK